MQVDEKTIAAFRELVSASSYEKVTISEICSKARISRKSFYAHFSNKNELLKQVFVIDIIKPLEDFRLMLPTASFQSAPQLLTGTVYRTILKYRSFYESLFGYVGTEGSAVRDISINIMTEQLIEFNVHALNIDDLPDYEKEYAPYYFAAATVALISKWVRESMPLTPDELTNVYLECTLSAMQGMGKRELYSHSLNAPLNGAAT